MNAYDLADLLGWVLAFNVILLLLWSGMVLFASDFVYRVHSRFVSLNREQFNQAHYLLMGVYKLFILVFVLSPWLALTFS